MTTDILRQNISQKVLASLKEQGRSKSWLYGKLGMTAPTLDKRLKSNGWKVSELIQLQDLIGIK